jgi:hypothetical protein
MRAVCAGPLRCRGRCCSQFGPRALFLAAPVGSQFGPFSSSLLGVGVGVLCSSLSPKSQIAKRKHKCMVSKPHGYLIFLELLMLTFET